jgi:predicted NAD/FAD-dependent oxidoreductase
MAQLGREFSRLNYETPDDELIRIVCGYLTRLYGPTFAHPVASTVMRWKYAQPESLIDFDTANPEGTTVLIAGDALSGARIEEAYETGLMAAERILS